MKRTLAALTAFLMIAAAGIPMAVHADNPIAQNVYTSDPAPMADGDTLYVYTGHDADGAEYYEMPDWRCYSTTDMQNWTDHGVVLSDADFAWAEHNSAWAAQTVKRGDKYYMYVTLVPAETGGRAIGVAVSDSPTGPFKDAIGKPLCGPNWDFIDPTVFIDDDGQAYLYFGNPTLYYVKLNEDMISYSGDIVKLDMTQEAFGVKEEKTTYTEGPWFYRRGDLYYMVYAANGIPEDIRYSTSPTPTGPWTYRGVIMPSEGRSFTNHPGIVDFQGHSYFAYHNGALPGGNGFQRSVCIEEFTYNPDGSIPTIKMTTEGPQQLHALDPYVRNEAETMSWSEGIETEVCEAGGLDIGFIENGDYVKISGADFGDGARKFTASAASAGTGGTIEIHLDKKDGPLVGTLEISPTDGWQNWKEMSCDVSGASGMHDVYFVFKGGESYLFNVDWWKFSRENEPSVTIIPGDVNFDGVVDVYDLGFAKRGVIHGFDDVNAAAAADVNRDGKADLVDVIAIQKFLLMETNTLGTPAFLPPELPTEQVTEPKKALSMAEFTAQCESRMVETEPESSHAENPGTQYGTIKSESYFSTTCNRTKPYNILLPA